MRGRRRRSVSGRRAIRERARMALRSCATEAAFRFDRRR
jgi:hypothetical protein